MVSQAKLSNAHTTSDLTNSVLFSVVYWEFGTIALTGTIMFNPQTLPLFFWTEYVQSVVKAEIKYWSLGGKGEGMKQLLFYCAGRNF